MMIIVFQDSRKQEDGSVDRPWVAHHAEKAVMGQGDDAEKALWGFVQWLKRSHNDGDESIGDLYAVHYPNPRDPKTDIGNPHGYEGYLREDDRAELGNEEAVARCFQALDECDCPWCDAARDPVDVRAKRLVRPVPRPHYPSASSEVVKKFANGKPFVPKFVPKDWDVRIWPEG